MLSVGMLSKSQSSVSNVCRSFGCSIHFFFKSHKKKKSMLKQSEKVLAHLTTTFLKMNWNQLTVAQVCRMEGFFFVDLIIIAVILLWSPLKVCFLGTCWCVVMAGWSAWPLKNGGGGHMDVHTLVLTIWWQNLCYITTLLKNVKLLCNRLNPILLSINGQNEETSVVTNHGLHQIVYHINAI